MSLTIRCPSCDQPLQVSPQHVGKTVRCPSCKAAIKVPPMGLAPSSGQGSPAPPPAPQFPPPPPPHSPPPHTHTQPSYAPPAYAPAPANAAPPAPAPDYVDSGSSGDLSFTSGGGSSRRSSSRLPRGMTPSTSILDIFDFSFKRYVTPLIVKITWILTLVLSLIWIASLSFWFLSGLVGDAGGASSRAAAGLSSSRAVGMAPTMEYETRPVGLSTSTTLLIARVTGYLTFLLGAIIGILWVRAVLEGIIVIFHIAETLVDIRSQVSRDGG
ncbi:MAG: DUF4282 domain-containing protein [Pirellulales bacterium]